MNQILDHSGVKKTKPQSNPNDIKKIIKVFAIIVLVFGVVLGGVGIVSAINNKSSDDTETNVVTEPTIVAEKDSESTVKLEVTYTETIETVEYNWDDETSQVLKGSSDQTTITKEGIGIPTGTHDLYVKVTDINGNEYNKTFEFSCEEGIDSIDPKADVIQQNYVAEIVATDETALAFMTYSINGGEEVTVEASEDDKTKISKVIELEEGQTVTISVRAVDESNNETIYTTTLTVYAKPVISAEKIAEDQIRVTITSNVEVSKVTIGSSNENGDSSTELQSEDLSTHAVESEEANYAYQFVISVTEPGTTTITIRAYIETADAEETYGEFIGTVEYDG